MAKVEFDRRADIQVAQPVAISEAECRLVLNVAGNALEAPARQSVLASVDQRHAPRLDLLLMYDDTVFRHVEGNVRHMQGIVRKVFLDYVPFVAAADHEIVGAMRRVELHDVPEDWLAADLDHRLGSEIALLGNTSAKAAS